MNYKTLFFTAIELDRLKFLESSFINVCLFTFSEVEH